MTSPVLDLRPFGKDLAMTPVATGSPLLDVETLMASMDPGSHRFNGVEA